MSATVRRGIVQAVAYANVFDYPLTVGERHRYLVGIAAPQGVVADMVASRTLPSSLSWSDGYVTIRGREAIVRTRRHRTEAASRMWPNAIHYGRTIANLPFVRMVAISGGLSMDNVEADADVDYLIVTAAGRLWLCRAAIILVVRAARQRGIDVCPNYLVSERALTLMERDLFTAHELAQMVPVAGMDHYHRMRRLNAWTRALLPNAEGPPRHVAPSRRRGRLPLAVAEAALNTPPGGWLDRWEMRRKARRFAAMPSANSEASFAPDWCKGHFGGHAQLTLAAYADRLEQLGVAE